MSQDTPLTNPKYQPITTPPKFIDRYALKGGRAKSELRVAVENLPVNTWIATGVVLPVKKAEQTQEEWYRECANARSNITGLINAIKRADKKAGGPVRQYVSRTAEDTREIYIGRLENLPVVQPESV